LTIKSAQHTTAGVRSQNPEVRIGNGELTRNPVAFPEPPVPNPGSRPCRADSPSTYPA